MNDNLKAYARHKITGKIIPLGEDNSPNLPNAYSAQTNKNLYDIIYVAKELVALFGFIFKVKVPRTIYVEKVSYGLTTRWYDNNQCYVGYSDTDGKFYIGFENSSEKEAKKSLKKYLEENQII